MRESSPAEKFIGVILAALFGAISYGVVVLNNLHSDLGALDAHVTGHITNHPNIPIEQDVDQLQRRLREHEIGHPQ